MNVLIDPYMLELSDLHEIEDNLSFFERIVRACNEKRIHIAFEEEIIKRIQMRSIQPFPIEVSSITDSDLRLTILQLNTQFSNALLTSIEHLNMDGCEESLSFKVSGDSSLVEDTKYYDMLWLLLTPCYSDSTEMDQRILTGKKKAGKQIGDTFSITCSCGVKEYDKEFVFVGIEEFFTDQDRAIIKLSEIKKAGNISVVDKIPATMGSHHNHITSDGRKFNYLDDLSLKNRGVLKLFKSLGLQKIIFGKFTSQDKGKVGTLKIIDVQSNDANDVMKVKFYAETDFEIDSDLYFPCNVGSALKEYFDNSILDKITVNRLIEKIN